MYKSGQLKNYCFINKYLCDTMSYWLCKLHMMSLVADKKLDFFLLKL